MKDQDKTQKQPTKELTQLRRRIVELEKKDTERKQAEEALRESEERYRVLFEEARDGIALADADTGILLDCNQALADLIGRKRAELIGQHQAILHPPSSNNTGLSTTFKKHLTNKKGQVLETQVLTVTGEIREVEIKANLLYLQGRKMLQGIFRDITERKQAEEALRKSEEKYRSIIENIQEGYFENDLAGNFTFLNDALCRIIGYPREELIGKNNRQYTDEKTAKKIYQVYNRIYRTGEPSKGIEEEYIRKDGTTLFAELSVSLISDAEGKPIGFRGIARDVTERKQAEAALRESETRFRTLFEAIPDTVLVHDDDGTILHINEIGAHRLEWSAQDLVGKNLRAIVTPENRASIADHDREMRKVGWCRFETTYVSSSGWRIAVDVNERPIKFGKEKAILSVARDITERKEAEKALVREKNFSNAIINSSPGLLFVFDEKGNIIQWNSSAERVTGYAASEISKMNVLEFVAKEDTKIAAEAVQEALTKGQASVEINVLSKSGKRIPFYIIGLRSKIENANCVVCTGIDITERKESEAALKESEQRFRTIFEGAIDGILLADIETKKFHTGNAMICKMLGYSLEEIKNLGVMDIHPQASLPFAMEQFDKLGKEKISKTSELPVKRKDGSVFYAEISAALLKLDGGSYLMGSFRDITERKRAEEEVKRSYEQQRQALLATVSALATTVEMKDQYTAGHQPRVTQLACAIAEEMGLPAGQIEGIRMAASIHDIGKIMVPAEILNKPGPLTELQFEMIKMHPKAGYDILKGIQFPWPVAEIVQQHHERLDGSGYPQGLSGEEIMLEARILIAANVVEAMTAHRLYRPALDIKEALAEISKNRGILYDPTVVDACIKLFTEKAFMFSDGVGKPRSPRAAE